MVDIQKVRNQISATLNIGSNETYKTQGEVDTANLKIFSTLEELFPNDIKVKHDTQKSNIVINCYAYALGLGNSDIYKNNLARQIYDSQKTGAQSNFISYLRKKKHLKRIKIPVKNGLVLYFDQAIENDTKKSTLIPRHAGILKRCGKTDFGKIIRSRWGNHKALLEHRLWYVGTNYGTLVKYYQPLSTEESEDYFYQFLEEMAKLPAKAPP